MNSDEGLTPEERAVIDALRRASKRDAEILPQLSEQDLRARFRTRLGLGANTIRRAIADHNRVTRTYEGPRVVTTGTLAHLKATWSQQHDHLVGRGASGAVLRHHREAVARYCKAAGIDWEPEASLYEKRSRAARTKRSENIELPEDFVTLVAHLVNDVQYHKDPAVNAMFQHRARLNFYTAPRCPSEDARLRVQDVHTERGVVIYRQSKIAGPEGEAVLVPREVFGLAPSALTWPTRKSWNNWVDHWRPKLVHRALLRRGDFANHDYAWPGPTGAPMNPEKYRLEFGLIGKTVWPGFYPYLVREVGIIMRALEIVQERGHLDLELLIQWTGQEKLDTLRRYTRKARQLLREAEPGPELDALLYDWRRI